MHTPPRNTHKHTHMLTHTHRKQNTQKYTHTHKHTHAHLHINIQIHTRTYANSHTHTNTHTRTQKRTQTSRHGNSRTQRELLVRPSLAFSHTKVCSYLTEKKQESESISTLHNELIFKKSRSL